MSLSLSNGRDENISNNGHQQRRQRRRSISDVDHQPVEKLSLVDVDHDKLSGVDVDRQRSSFIYYKRCIFKFWKNKFYTDRRQPNWCFLLVNVGRRRLVENISLVNGRPRTSTVDVVDGANVRFYWCFHQARIIWVFNIWPDIFWHFLLEGLSHWINTY